MKRSIERCAFPIEQRKQHKSYLLQVSLKEQVFNNVNPVRRKTLLQHCIAKQNAYFARYILDHQYFSLSTLFFRDPNGLDTLDSLIIEPKDFDFAPYMVEQILGLKNM